MWREVAWASTGGGTGIETAMNFIVSLVLAVAGAGVVAAIAYRGLQLVWANERQHTGEWMIGLGLGGGLIAGCKIIGAQIVGFALGATVWGNWGSCQRIWWGLSPAICSGTAAGSSWACGSGGFWSRLPCIGGSCMDDKPMEGWSAPVYHALASPAALLMLGVPQTFLILTFLGTLCLTMLWWRAALIGIAVYAIGLVGTQYEVQWWEMLRAYRRYKDYYEG